MLYTVMPLERIYTDFRGREAELHKSGDNSEAEEEYQEVLLPHGRIVTRRNGKDFIVERINSTDMNDYLNEEYYPGKIITRQR